MFGVVRISGNTAAMRNDVGYCPQVNALDDFMTGRSLLNFYCQLKGVAGVKQVRDVRQ